jgi:hypothetical protein
MNTGPREFFVTLQVTVKVRVNDPLVLSRPVENTDGWRDDLYDLRTEDDVLGHLAYNCAVNGYHNGLLLDGWADLPVGAVGMDVTDSETWSVDETVVTK